VAYLSEYAAVIKKSFMNERSIKIIAATGLMLGGIFGMVGSFVSPASLRCLAWGSDGVGIIVASALLSINYFRKGLDMTAAGFLIFALGESLILSSCGIDLDANLSSFGAGTSLWAASLFVISFQKTYPLFIRFTGLLTAVLFSVVAVQIFKGSHLNGLTKPLPFYAYPFFVITIFGWVWTLLREHSLLLKETN
jgi:hypothetical protein